MANNKINKLYIANRGEIALRIQAAAKKLSIPCCIGISEADRNQSFAKKAQETIIIGPTPAAQSYLAIEVVIEAARKTGCNAVHPGYGFLSENHLFAEAAIRAGLIWVGPDPESIRLMGSKIEGRKRAIEAKVSVVPGSNGGLSDKQLLGAAKKIGLPLIIKAVGGGGGRGMRVIRSMKELADLLPQARSEALKNFGDDQIFIERFLDNPRHVEVQLLGDQHGKLIHLGTRDCSAQRRHQKLIEEAPAPFLTEKMRSDIHKAAIAVAKSVGYYSAGTAEFLVEGKNFYFLEMNTRIQVEHPVTELVSGVDLVVQQLLIAQGEQLALSQAKIKIVGHAIEFRINAENPEEKFAPTIGEIRSLTLPQASEGRCRNDFGFETGDVISPFYDGLIGKIIVYGTNRQQALQQAVRILKEFDCLGLVTNCEFHRWLIRTRIFNQTGIGIGFVEKEFAEDCIGDLRAAEIKEVASEHRADLPEQISRCENLRVDVSGKRRKQLTIIERHDGVFVASIDGKSPKTTRRVASNSRARALEEILSAASK